MLICIKKIKFYSWVNTKPSIFVVHSPCLHIDHFFTLRNSLVTSLIHVEKQHNYPRSYFTKENKKKNQQEQKEESTTAPSHTDIPKAEILPA